MSEVHTVWYDHQTRQRIATNRQRGGFLLIAAALIAMCAAQAMFLIYVASPETVAMVTAGEVMSTGGQ